MSAPSKSYLMNPAEDVVLFGDEITEGMWVLFEDRILRPGSEASEDQQMRGQRFCRVTRLRKNAEHLWFVGEWVDGYQEVEGPVALSYGWIVKKSSLPATGGENAEEVGA